MSKWSDLFTSRQLVTLEVLSDLTQDVRDQVIHDFSAYKTDDKSRKITEYADVLCTYLSFAISRLTMRSSSQATWDSSYLKIQNAFGRQALSMVWDYCEGNPFSTSSGNFSSCYEAISDVLSTFVNFVRIGQTSQANAQLQTISQQKIVSTDPPYYDNVPYADLSDFFYVWLRRSLKPIFPDLFSTLAVPKTDELIAAPYRHGGKEKAEIFFLEGMTQAMTQLAHQSHPAFPITIYYAFKQSETKNEYGISSTGWETFLEAVIRSGLTVAGTWPVRTEMKGRVRERSGSNALASSIVLVCHKCEEGAITVSRREFVNALKTELPKALAHLQAGNIAPVDLAQAAIGPGMAIYTRYAKVLDAQGQPLTVRDALALINQTLDESLAEQEGDFDADTRWALAWFEQSGFDENEYGVAETLSKAKDTSVSGMVEAGILASGRGKVRLLKPAELPVDWDPSTDSRLTTWEMVHQLIRVLESDGESAAAQLVAQLGSQAETARELCYRLYTICERKKRNAEALSYNGLVQSWPEITRLARETVKPSETQATLF